MNLSQEEIERRTKRILRHEDRQRATWLIIGASIVFLFWVTSLVK